MSLTLTMASGDGVPPGAYTAEFVGFEPTENDYGKGLKWAWKIVSGEHAGRKACRITSDRPTLKNACGRMLVAVLGKPPTVGESIDLTACVGRRYTIMVQQGQSGGTRVESVALQP